MKTSDYYRKYQDTCLSLSDFCPSRITRTLELIPERYQRILDIGCANGILSELFRKKGNDIVGIEINEKLAKEARKRLDYCLVSDIEEIWPLQPCHFDIVVMNAILEHIFDYHHMLNEANRVLKVNGQLIITVPNSANLYDRFRFLCGKQPMWYINFGHIRLWTKPFLKVLLRLHGFNVIRWLGAERLLTFLEKIYPTLCRILICKAIKVKDVKVNLSQIMERSARF